MSGSALARFKPRACARAKFAPVRWPPGSMRGVRVDADISFTESPRWTGEQGDRKKGDEGDV